MFLDRKDAGKKLAQKLKKYQQKKDVIILAIPRGGVAVAVEVAKMLKLPLDLIIVRKLPMPDEPEAGIGAVSETGEIVWQPHAKLYPKKIVDQILKQQKREIQKRLKILREEKSLPPLKGKIVILIDDGVAMGSTMICAIKTVKKFNPQKIIVAVPISGKETLEKIKKMVDEIICLETPSPFYAVAQGYRLWHDLTDEEVKEILKSYKKNARKRK